jgi:hypothetical protein
MNRSLGKRLQTDARRPQAKKARSLSVDIKLRSRPLKAGQIVYEEEGIIREQGKESPTIQANMFSSRSKSFSKEKRKRKEGRKRLPVPVKKRLSGNFKHRLVKEFYSRLRNEIKL